MTGRTKASSGARRNVAGSNQQYPAVLIFLCAMFIFWVFSRWSPSRRMGGALTYPAETDEPFTSRSYQWHVEKVKAQLKRSWVNPYLVHIPRRKGPIFKPTPGLVEKNYSNDFGPDCDVTSYPEWNLSENPKCTFRLKQHRVESGGTIIPKILLTKPTGSFSLKTEFEKLEKTWGEGKINTVELIHASLEKAWGLNYPRIDLYVRTGCIDLKRLGYLLESLYIFWPRFLGRIIVGLDWNDRYALAHAIPERLPRTHDVLVVYEHMYNFTRRQTLAQYSYLYLHRHSEAEYVVTIDADCALHTPYTPDQIFDETGKIIHPMSRRFQRTFPWDEQMFFTNVSIDQVQGHSMVSQPITYHVPTFQRYLDYVRETWGVCYEIRLAQMNQAGITKGFCWMCQVSVFAAWKQLPEYHFLDLVHSHVPFVRAGIHYKYEPLRHAGFDGTVIAIVQQSLCRHFRGRLLLPDCDDTMLAGAFHKRRALTYNFKISLVVPDLALETAYNASRDRFQDLLFQGVLGVGA